MEKKTTRSISFFNASLLLEDLSENEMFKLKGGMSEPSQPSEPSEPSEPAEDPEEDEDPDEDYDPIPPGTDPEEGDDWDDEDEDPNDDDEDNDPTDDPGWDDETGSSGDEPPPTDPSDGTPPPPPPDSTDHDKGPWLRDSQGHLITTDTGETAQVEYSKYIINFKEVCIKTPDGTEVTAFQVSEVIDKSTGQPMASIPSNFNANCTGFAFAGGDVWILDPQSSPENEEFTFDNLLHNNTLFTPVSKDQADVAVIYWTDPSTNETFIAHSAEVNDDGTYNQKSDYGSIQKNVSESDFTAGHLPGQGYTYTIEYYKRNY